MADTLCGGDYNLSFYTVPKDELPRRRLSEGEAVDFLELHGTPCGEEVGLFCDSGLTLKLTFRPGSVFPFFEVLHSLTQVDLMCLVGVAPNAARPEEDELCCGSCEPVRTREKWQF